MPARPVLLWALERSWSAAEAGEKGMELSAQENSAWLVLTGEALVTHEGTEHHAGPGDWMFPKPCLRRQNFAGDFRFLSVTFRWRWPDGRHLFEDGLTKVVRAADLAWLEPAAREVIDTVAGIAPGVPYYLGGCRISLSEGAELFGAAGKWAACFARAMEQVGVRQSSDSVSDARIAPILLRIRASLGEPQMDRERLAHEVGLSPRQLDRLFKQATGSTPTEHHDLMRFEYAREQLLEPDSRIKEVASALGFGDLAAFSRWFSRRAGCSARDYRKKFL